MNAETHHGFTIGDEVIYDGRDPMAFAEPGEAKVVSFWHHPSSDDVYVEVLFVNNTFKGVPLKNLTQAIDHFCLTKK